MAEAPKPRGPLKVAARRLERGAKQLIPYSLRTLAKTIVNLEKRYGHFRTAARLECVDARGAPLPWYTYPAIEYLAQFDFSDRALFEFGSGNSTLFWAGRCRSVVSVEDDAAWHARVSRAAPANATCLLEPARDRYIGALAATGRDFDVIVVDGSHRKACAAAAIGRLRPGGFIVLDNADWFPHSAALLRGAGLIQVDMHGFGPINAYSWTTSLFLDRAFAPKPRAGRQPGYSVCAVRAVNDEP